MFWESWSRADQLALLGIAVAALSLLATVAITWVVYRLSSKSGRVGQQALEKMEDIQGQLHAVVQRNRRDDLLTRLRNETNDEMLRILRAEVDSNYTGEDRRILQSVYRANPLTPLPHRDLSQVQFDDFLPSIPERLDRKHNQRGDIVHFVSAAQRNDLPDRWKLASALYEGSTVSSILPHSFYREVVAADWQMAPHLVDVVASSFDREEPARSTNLLTGVFVALIDIDPRSSSGEGMARTLTCDEDPVLQARMLQSLAGLLYNGPLTMLDRIGHGRPGYEWGSTENLTALVAWLIRASGNAVQGDEHLEMRLMQSLTAVVRAVRRSPDWQIGWGVDDEDVQVGMLRMRYKCPELWAQYGEDLVAATSVPLEPRITLKRDGRRPSLSPPRDTRWPEPYDVPDQER